MSFKNLASSTMRVLAVCSLTIPLLTACETNNDRAIADAEHCINSADSSNVDQCVAKVAGMESQQAYLIRCSADFIAQGLTASKLASGFANIKNPSNSGTPPTTVALSYLVFNENLPTHNVATSMDDCYKSGATSLYRLTLLANVATTAVTLAGHDTAALNNSVNLGQIKSDLGQLGTNNPTVLGNMAINIRDNFCTNGSSYASSDVCNKVNAAYLAAGGDPLAIGQQLGSALNQ